MTNPFFYPNPVPPSGLLGRREEIQRIVRRILTDGQSTAIIGEPRSGKTSLLEYLAAPETHAELFGANSSNLLTTLIDGETLGSQFTRSQFWETTMHSVYKAAVLPQPDSALAAAYEHCRKNGFGTQQLESLLLQMRASHWRLVLLLDEFDAFLNHPVLHSVDFFGGLRSLASRGKGALALVIASRNPLASLNEATRSLSREASPYFNFLSTVSLGPWTESTVEQLLDRAANRFTCEDRLFITAIAGGQPYLLQVAAHETWQAYEEGGTEAQRREQAVGKRVYAEVTSTLDDIWRLWSPMTKMAFTAVGLPQITSMRGEFRERYLLAELRHFGPELKQLKDRGWIIEDASVDAGWRVRPQVFLWWLADEIAKNVRDESTFEQWLRNQKAGSVRDTARKTESAARVAIPYDDLRSSLATGNVCAFVGTGLSVDSGRAYVNHQKLYRLVSYLKDRLDITGKQPTAAHRALTRLPISLVFTVSFDDLLERAFRDAGKRVEVIVRDSSIPFMRRGPDTVNIVKLYGDLDQPDTIVPACQQYESYFLLRPQMVKLLEAELARSDMLYLGWSGSDPYFKMVFGELLSRFEGMMRPSYAAMLDVTDVQRDELARKKIRLVELSAGDRTAQLTGWLENLAAGAIPTAPPPQSTWPTTDGMGGSHADATRTSGSQNSSSRVDKGSLSTKPDWSPESRQDTPTWNTAILRDLLGAAFGDEELTTLCFDHFRSVYEDFAIGMSKGQKTQRLLDYCIRYEQMEALLVTAQKANPAQYRRFESSLRG